MPEYRIPSDVLRAGRPPRVVVLRALKLGDLLCAIPSLRALRLALPSAHVTVIGLPWSREFLGRYPAYVDEFVEFPGFPGIPEVPEVDPLRTAAFLAAMQARKFDLAIQLQGNGVVTNAFTCLLGARWNLGAIAPDRPLPGPGTWVPFLPHAHEIDRHLAVIGALGAPVDDRHLEFPVDERDRADLERALGGQRLAPGSYACIHPGATAPSRRWPAERFAAVADELARRGLGIVLTGSGEERPLVAQVRRAMMEPALDLSGRTSLGGLAALLEAARLVVANDTGLSHLAAALGVPSAIVFVGSDPVRWAPLDWTRHRALGGVPEANGCVHAPGDADRCLGDGCTWLTRQTSRQPASDVGVRTVLEAAVGLLEQRELVA